MLNVIETAWCTAANSSSIPTTLSAPLRWLRVFFFMAQPPLLYQAELSKLGFWEGPKKGLTLCIRSAKRPSFAINRRKQPRETILQHSESVAPDFSEI